MTFRGNRGSTVFAIHKPVPSRWAATQPDGCQLFGWQAGLRVGTRPSHEAWIPSVAPASESADVEDMTSRTWRLLLSIPLILGWTVAAGDGDPEGWFDFDPSASSPGRSLIDLRFLNEGVAGERGYIRADGDQFVHSSTRDVVRFWAVNGPPSNLSGSALKHNARFLAGYGVNLVRMHGAIFDKSGAPDFKKVSQLQENVAALKEQGIYSHFSIYFPLWMTPAAAGQNGLKGYDGRKHPFAALFFNREFQEQYRAWWKALLLTPDGAGKRLVDDPAVFGVEIQNEDSFFFWTFNPDQIPGAQLEILEARFGSWLKERHGSLEAAVAGWNGVRTARDDFAAGRVGFRPLYNLFTERTARDRDTAKFLLETQMGFYRETVEFLRSLGFKGLITASNWSTASPEVLGPLERWSYTVGDFLDRHGYFSVSHKGDNAEWSIRNGHTFSDRSALRFESATPGKAKQFVHPSMEITYNGKPSMISETTWNRPNRFRSEAPVYFSVYGAMQGTDAIVHFALDGARWSVKPGFWMQPWTLMAPSQMAQFPAAALIFRRGLIKSGEVLARVQLNTNDLLNLRGTPLPQDANFDELRLKDVPSGTEVQPGQRIDPLIHLAGRTEVQFVGTGSRTELKNLQPWIDRNSKTVRSSTGELQLDYERGVLRINAPSAQGASGNLKSAGEIELADVSLRSGLDNIHVVLVSLDDQPVSRSQRMLLQVLTEERSTGFAVEDAGGGLKRITDIGRDPWQVKNIEGSMRFKRRGGLRVQPLDFNGAPSGPVETVSEVRFAPRTLYYLLTAEQGGR